MCLGVIAGKYFSSDEKHIEGQHNFLETREHGNCYYKFRSGKVSKAQLIYRLIHNRSSKC
jgi:hypothetical protein